MSEKNKASGGVPPSPTIKSSLPKPLVPLPGNINESPNCTLADLMNLITTKFDSNEKMVQDKLDQATAQIDKTAEENKRQNDELRSLLGNKLISLQQQSESHGQRVDSVEKTVGALQQNMSIVTAEIDDIKSTVRHIQNVSISNSNFQPPLNSTNNFHTLNNSCLERLSDAVPQFNGHRNDVHPEKFLYELNQYFLNQPLTDNYKICTFQRRLFGNARTWYDSLLPCPETYRELVALFRQQFWSFSTQRRVRNEIFSPFQYKFPGGLVNHAMKWISKAKYLSPPIESYDLVGIITQHFPTNLKMAILGRNPKTTNELLTVLSEIEESSCDNDFPNVPPTQNRFSSCSTPGHHNNGNHQNSNPRNNRYGNHHNNNRYDHSYRNNENQSRNPNAFNSRDNVNNSPGNNRSDPFRTARGPLNGAPRNEESDRPIYQLTASGNEEEAAT